MTPADKAALLDQYAGPVAAEAAAQFRALILDANGLLPCPMCGAKDGKPVIIGTFSGGFNAACETCLLRTGYCMSKADAIASWNRRGGVLYE